MEELIQPKVEEGLFIVSLEIWPLPLDTSAFASRNLVNRVWDRAVRRRVRSDRACDRTVRSKPELGPGLDRSRICRAEQAAGPRPGQPGGRPDQSGPDRSAGRASTGRRGRRYWNWPGVHRSWARSEPGHPAPRPIRSELGPGHPAPRPVRPELGPASC